MAAPHARDDRADIYSAGSRSPHACRVLLHDKPRSNRHVASVSDFVCGIVSVHKERLDADPGVITHPAPTLFYRAPRISISLVEPDEWQPQTV